MKFAPSGFYRKHPSAIWVLFDLQDPEQCETLHLARLAWREYADLAALGPDHMILSMFPGGALELL